MKKLILSTILLAASYGFAADPDPTPTPEPTPVATVEGTWNVTSRACTSNAPINDGIKLGEDKLSVTNNKDMTFEYITDVAGCETLVKGTYAIDGMKVTYTTTSSQGCKDTDPVPLNKSFSLFVAYLNDLEAVTVATGDKAAEVCPAGDALVVHYEKEMSTPPTP